MFKKIVKTIIAIILILIAIIIVGAILITPTIYTEFQRYIHGSLSMFGIFLRLKH